MIALRASRRADAYRTSTYRARIIGRVAGSWSGAGNLPTNNPKRTFRRAAFGTPRDRRGGVYDEDRRAGAIGARTKDREGPASFTRKRSVWDRANPVGRN